MYLRLVSTRRRCVTRGERCRALCRRVARGRRNGFFSAARLRFCVGAACGEHGHPGAENEPTWAANEGVHAAFGLPRTGASGNVDHVAHLVTIAAEFVRNKHFTACRIGEKARAIRARGRENSASRTSRRKRRVGRRGRKSRCGSDSD